MKDYQKRVVIERFELSAKIEKLIKFLDNRADTLKADECIRLEHQLNFMVGYLAVLDSRIQHFKS